ncbi:MAG: HAD family phosphatase [Isosphaeraceae bacterium]|nr:HAD family phosphatase [Isosphaeraceae bacterium]
MAPHALLLDFDGVIADTENIHIAAWQRTFARLGWEMADEICARAVEVDDRSFFAEVLAQKKIEGGDVEGWVRWKQELTRSMLADAPRIYPGVEALVHAVRPLARLAVVTTTWRVNVETVLAATGLAGAFDAVIAKEDVRAVKPDPECYRLALERLGIPAAAACALEDSPTGLAAAQGAGIPVVAVGHRREAGEWSAVVPFVADLTRTDVVLQVLGFRRPGG